VAERHGLTDSQVQTDVELRLRRAGIRVLTPDEQDARPGSPYLYININTKAGDGPSAGLIAVNINVELRQSVRLARDPDIWVLHATTWSKSVLGLGGHAQLRHVRESLGDQVDKFINDYYAANPERTPVQVPKPVPVPAPRQEKRR
jgi:hypothetical protein